MGRLRVESVLLMIMMKMKMMMLVLMMLECVEIGVWSSEFGVEVGVGVGAKEILSPYNALN